MLNCNNKLLLPLLLSFLSYLKNQLCGWSEKEKWSWETWKRLDLHLLSSTFTSYFFWSYVLIRDINWPAYCIYFCKFDGKVLISSEGIIGSDTFFPVLISNLAPCIGHVRCYLWDDPSKVEHCCGYICHITHRIFLLHLQLEFHFRQSPHVSFFKVEFPLTLRCLQIDFFPLG